MLGGATLTTQSPSWIDMGSSLGLRAEIPLTKRTSQLTSIKCVSYNSIILGAPVRPR